MSKSLVVFEQVFVAYFKTETENVYDVHYLKKAAKNKLLKDLNANRVVQLGESLLASRLFEKCVPFEAATVPDERVRFEFAHRIAEIKKSGRDISPQLAHQIEMKALEKKQLAFRVERGRPDELRRKYTKSIIKPVILEVGDEGEDFWVIKKA